MINVNIPRTTTASFQPDYTRTAEYPGFVFYHSLKEWYFIYSDTNIQVYPDRLLDELDLQGAFSFLIGNNTNNIFIGQCETATLAKLQINPNTGQQVAYTSIDLKSIVQAQLGTSQDVILTSGYVNGTTVILTLAVSLNDAGGLTNPQPYIIVSTDNGGTWDARPMTLGTPTEDQIPVGITRINFYDTYYIVSLVRSYTLDNLYMYIGSEEDILNSSDTLYYHQTVSVALSTFNTDRRIHINRRLNWNHNCLQFLNDDRTRVIKGLTHLHAQQDAPYTTPYPIPDFEFVFDPAPTGQSFTQIEPVPDSELFSFYTGIYTKQDTVSNGATANLLPQYYEKGIVWNLISDDLVASGTSIIDIRALNNDVILFGLVQGPTVLPFVSRGGLVNNNPNITTSLETIPMDRFNTGGQHWNGEIVNPLPTIWAPNNATSQWISVDADTDLIDYGANDFDYSLTFSVDLPEDLDLTGQIYYDDEVLDIIVDGVSTGNNLTATAVTTSLPISLTLTRGPHNIVFNMRNAANPGAGNPTGLRIEWDPITVGIAATEAPTFEADFTDMFVDEAQDRLYLSLGRSAWVLELSTLTIISYLDLHAEPLVFSPPFPPGYDPLIITGVTDDTHIPIKWKWLKNFNDVYIYNSYHEDTYTNTDSKEFYMWVIDDEDPSYHTMFSAFDLARTIIAKIQYFYSLNNELHMVRYFTDGVINVTRQSRLSGLAQFNQVQQDEIPVGPIDFSDVYVDKEGAVYVTESAEPSYTAPQNTLFIYKNDNGADIDNGTYLIEIDDQSDPFDADDANYITYTPAGHPSVVPDYWGKSLVYTEVPGDYTSSVFLNSRYFRDDSNNKNFFYRHVANFSSRNNINITNEAFLKADTDPQRHWTYFLTYDDVNSKNRLYRARALYYPEDLN